MTSREERVPVPHISQDLLKYLDQNFRLNQILSENGPSLDRVRGWMDVIDHLKAAASAQNR